MSRHIKSRSGCRVCKAKRLKCDEAVPACRNCVNRGITCPGYRQVLRWSTKYEHPTAKAKAKGEALLDFSPGPSGSSSAGSSVANGTFPQFSELASAVTQSIKPDEGLASRPRPPQQQPPLVKVEQLTSGSRLSQVPPVPPVPQSALPVPVPAIPPQTMYGPDLMQSSPVAASASPLSQQPNQRSPMQMHTPYMPTSSPFLIPSPSVISIASSSDPTDASVDRGDDWGPAAYGSEISFDRGSVIPGGPLGLSSDDGHDGHDEASKSDGEFRLALWQPERMRDMRRQQHQQHQQSLALASSPPRALTLAGTSLVELWFKSVCGMWAAMDSPTNPFRRLCSSLWSSNEAVFFSMQTMAAASLPKRPPNISEIVMLAPQMSTQALINELQDLFTDKGGGGAGAQKKDFRFPSGLLTSLFCMSSSLSWIDARQLGVQYLRNARSVIDLIDLHADQLSADDRELLEFFRGCLIYEEMVRSVVTDDQEDIQALLDWQPPSLNGRGSGSGSGGSSSSSRNSGDKKKDKTKDKASLGLHAWAGVPIVLVALFGKVMALCRRSRKRWRRTTTTRATYQLLYESMLDIQEGQSLEEMLLAISIPALIGRGDVRIVDDNDDEDGGAEEEEGDSKCGFLSSPPASPELKSDIYNAAEAFRLLSLLQLYQTFPDLLTAQQQQQQQQQQVVGLLGGQYGQCDSKPSLHSDTLFGNNINNTENNTENNNYIGANLDSSGSLMPMALRTVWLLEAIPPDSPMRCLQPLLVICAGSALRLDGDGGGNGGGGGSPSLLTEGVHVGAGGAAAQSVEPILQARAALSRRLCRLEQNLPPRPITVARQLLDMVWMRYDTDVPPSRSHWLDIMAETEFESVFG